MDWRFARLMAHLANIHCRARDTDRAWKAEEFMPDFAGGAGVAREMTLAECQAAGREVMAEQERRGRQGPPASPGACGLRS